MKKMSKYGRISLVISVIVAITIVLLANFNSEAIKIAFIQGPATEEDYQVLKNYAMDLAKGKEIDNDDLKIEKNVDTKNLIIKLETSKMYGIVAAFPITLEEEINYESNTIEYKGTIDYGNVVYSEYTDVQSKFSYIILDLLGFALSTIVLYVTIYWGPKELIRNNSQSK